jgi:hypothetical protein
MLVFFLKILLRTQGLFECQICIILSIILLTVAGNNELQGLIGGRRLPWAFQHWGYLLEMGLHLLALLAEWRLYQLIKIRKMYDLDGDSDSEHYYEED